LQWSALQDQIPKIINKFHVPNILIKFQIVVKSLDMVAELNSCVHVECSGGTQMNKLVMRFLGDNSGATAIEYGLIAAGISVAIIVAVQAPAPL
jgi:pilus assembly protein Flp/PilA